MTRHVSLLFFSRHASRDAPRCESCFGAGTGELPGPAHRSHHVHAPDQHPAQPTTHPGHAPRIWLCCEPSCCEAPAIAPALNSASSLTSIPEARSVLAPDHMLTRASRLLSKNQLWLARGHCGSPHAQCQLRGEDPDAVTHTPVGRPSHVVHTLGGPRSLWRPTRIIATVWGRTWGCNTHILECTSPFCMTLVGPHQQPTRRNQTVTNRNQASCYKGPPRNQAVTKDFGWPAGRWSLH